MALVEQVRDAAQVDLLRMVELTDAFHDAIGERRGGLLGHPGDPGGSPPKAISGDVEAYLEDPDRMALVGTLDDWVAGVALCRVVGTAGGRGVLDVCFVEPGARQVGLGQMLLERSLNWFSDRGCVGVDGTALPGDREAKQFYESAGFKARLLVMHRELD